ncbi:MAG: general glycosylation pathway protein [Chlamydiia bacterium]|nr:general glycosylation pathway protein [Chlamydiia bacterium]
MAFFYERVKLKVKDMKEPSIKIIVRLSNFGYVAACIVLYLIALCILVSAIWGILADMRSGSYTVYKLLDEVGLIVFSMAVIDVGKYLMLEEVIRKGKPELHPPQTRKTLTKFAIIIASALSLEGLVLTIEVAKLDVTKILYPVSVLITATIFIMGIGVYQILNSRSESKQ